MDQEGVHEHTGERRARPGEFPQLALDGAGGRVGHRHGQRHALDRPHRAGDRQERRPAAVSGRVVAAGAEGDAGGRRDPRGRRARQGRRRGRGRPVVRLVPGDEAAPRRGRGEAAPAGGGGGGGIRYLLPPYS